MATERDMSERQFAEALARYGMREAGFMGYVNINVPGHHIEVSKLNAGMRRRSQLAYLLRQRDAAMRECRNCGKIYEDHFRMTKDDKGRTIVLRPCPDDPAKTFREPGY